MAFELKFSKFDNTPWGFRLTGGSDYGLPLIVVKVTEGSISDQIGLRNNDILLKVNQVDTTSLTHDEAHGVILKAGNNFVATVIRENTIPTEPESFQMSTNEIMAQTNTVPAPYVNGTEQENIKMEEEVVMMSQESQSLEISEQMEHASTEESKEMAMNEDITVESAPQTFTMGDQAKSFATTTMNGVQTIANGTGDQFNGGLNDMEEDIGKAGLADQEIFSIISGHAEQTKEQHVVGLQKVLASHMRRPDDEINKNENPEMLPVFGFLRDSEVFKALNEESLKEKAERLQEERRKYTTFLQKPNRPIPYDKKMVQQLEFEEPPYRVNIKKQPKKDKNDLLGPSILSEGVFLVPEVPILIPEPTPQYYEAPEYLSDSSFPDLEDTGIPLPVKVPAPVVEENMNLEDTTIESDECENKMETEVQQNEEARTEHSTAEEDPWNETMICDDTIDENLTMEEQLTKVQKQLMALAKLPATIQQTIDIVTKQLSKMVPKLDTAAENHQQEEKVTNGEAPAENGHEEELALDEDKQEGEEKVEVIENGDSKVTLENVECEVNGKEHVENGETVEEFPEKTTNGVAEKITNGNVEKKEETMNLNEHQKIEKMKKDLMDELSEEHMMRQVKQRPSGRVGKPKPVFGPLVPQERPIVLPGGRKWKGPKDAFTDSFIAETLSGQAEVIMGKALGSHFEKIYPSYAQRVNFMKFNKPPIALGHLKESSVFKMVHDIDEPPHHGIQDRASVVLAESEFREKCRSVTPSSFDKVDMSMES